MTFNGPCRSVWEEAVTSRPSQLPTDAPRASVADKTKPRRRASRNSSTCLVVPPCPSTSPDSPTPRAAAIERRTRVDLERDPTDDRCLPVPASRPSGGVPHRHRPTKAGGTRQRAEAGGGGRPRARSNARREGRWDLHRGRRPAHHLAPDRVVRTAEIGRSGIHRLADDALDLSRRGRHPHPGRGVRRPPVRRPGRPCWTGHLGPPPAGAGEGDRSQPAIEEPFALRFGWIKVGRGWLETGSGRRRFASRAITMILRESCDSEAIEVRIVSDARVVRLRFESVDDPRFRAFWIRWGARRIESASRRAA